LPFVGLLWLGIRFGGVTGAAAVWGVRVAADGILLFVATRIVREVVIRLAPSMILVGLALASSFAVSDRLIVHLTLAAGFAVVAAVVTHFTSPEITQILSRRLRTMFGRRELVTFPETE